MNPETNGWIRLTPVLCLLLLAIAAYPRSLAQEYMLNKAHFDAGSLPDCLATGDFNGDGVLDLVVVNGAFPGTVSILLGRPDATFQPEVQYASGTPGSFPTSVVVGDFNRDGKLDLAVTNFNENTVSILLGDGDGSFQEHQDYATGAEPESVAIGDFNLDGKLDLAVANLGDNTVSILLGNGNGTFRTAEAFATGIGPISVIADDFNVDGKPDLAVTNQNANSVSILLGNGDGTFQLEVSYSTGGSPIGIRLGDFNGDRKLDLVVANAFDGTVSILLGNGDGTFQSRVDYSTGRNANPNSLSVADFNQDGKLDLCVSQSGAGFGTTVSIILGNGDGSFRAPNLYSAEGAAFVISGDFNGDSKPDLVVAGGTSPGHVSILLGDGRGAFQNRSEFAVGMDPFSITAGDFNRDGKLDLAVANNSDARTVSILLGKGDGSFETHTDYATGGLPVSVTTGDFNSDGNVDLAIANGGAGIGSTVSILLGNGDGTFRTHVDYGTGDIPFSVVSGDLNGDGKLDLAIANIGANTVSILLGNGDGTFQTHKDYGTGWQPISVAVADFNGDGKLDLSVSNEFDNTVSILLGNGDGTFKARVDYAVASTPMSVVAEDFNKDGKIDLAVANNFPGSVSILLGNGDGTFQPRVDYPAGNNPVSITAGDFNHDRRLELAVINMNDSTVSILLGNGDGTFQPHVDYSTGAFPTSIVTGDFNRDGNIDMATANGNANTVSVLLNTPVVALFPKRLSFSDQVIGTRSAEKVVIISNPSIVPLRLNNFKVIGNNSSDFAIANNTCTNTLDAGASCMGAVIFKPRAIGTRTAAITINDNALSRLQTVGLTGSGTVVSLLPPALTFTTQVLGTSSVAKTVTVKNTATTTLSISNIAITGRNRGDFAISSTSCGGSLAGGASCKVSIRFKPTAINDRNANLSITDNGGGSPQQASLMGTGTAVSLSPGSLDFGSQMVGTESSPKLVKMTNNGKTILTISDIGITGMDNSDFSISSKTCGGSLKAGASCSLDVTFKPTAKGTRSADLSISDNGGGSPQIVSLTGDGT